MSKYFFHKATLHLYNSIFKKNYILYMYQKLF